MNSNTLKSFTITSHNICGFNSLTCRTELAMFLAKTQPAVLVLQEPKMDPATPAPPIKHYHGIHFSHPSKHTGIIMYIHHSVSYHLAHTSIPPRKSINSCWVCMVIVSPRPMPHCCWRCLTLTCGDRGGCHFTCPINIACVYSPTNIAPSLSSSTSVPCW